MNHYVSRTLLPVVPALLGLVFLATPGLCSAVFLVDDREEPLGAEADLELCATDPDNPRLVCAAWDGESSDLLGGTRPVRAEGPDHGPVVFTPGALRFANAEGGTLVVPRKSELVVVWKGDEAASPTSLVASLYPFDAPTSRHPVSTQDVVTSHDGTPRGSVKIPAGEHLLSLSARGFAPDLHELVTVPGEQVTVNWRPRVGWSLAIRVTDPEGRPASGARIGVSTFGFETEHEGPTRRTKTSSHGLALLSGLELELAAAQIDHDDHVLSEITGLMASPGTFDAREVRLSRGGKAHVEVFVDGEPAPETACSIVDRSRPFRGHDGSPQPTILAKSDSDDDGACTFPPLAEGIYTLAVEPKPIIEDSSATPSRVERELALIADQVEHVDLDLRTIPFEAIVYVDGEPTPDYGIVVYLGAGHLGTPAAQGTTDPAGTFLASLWEPGTYVVSVRGPDGTPAATPMRRIALGATGETVEFRLSSTAIAGRVVDQEDRPVDEALVTLTWVERSHRATRTDEHGAYAFPVQESTGTARLEAHAAGYHQPSGPREVEVAPGSKLPPILLRLERLDGLTGRLTTADGRPVIGGWAASYAVIAGQPPVFLGESRTEPDGSFHLPAGQTATTRVFASGPGCPLDIFEVQSTGDTSGRLELSCASAASGMRVEVSETSGTPSSGGALLLRRSGLLVPQRVLASHMGLLGLPPSTDNAGRATLPLLAPATYELFLSGPEYSTSEQTVAAGLSMGLLGAVDLGPGEVVDLQVMIDSR